MMQETARKTAGLALDVCISVDARLTQPVSLMVNVRMDVPADGLVHSASTVSRSCGVAAVHQCGKGNSDSNAREQ